ncbi:S1C family serine protease [Leifsonia virtsii]|uniref:Trypsin-like peptidase domain-containing protein n=1 Tax=Leifsonia virtsii TaxID=3035915 RepID=A0ABT8J4L3_9MICO|nr:trypsin-like peptidase domain-containing protein [Leifsonia virtsii]MDN4599204.1 trypsin-like peptidase domain-containing protein [Leifsonia virtsii]
MNTIDGAPATPDDPGAATTAGGDGHRASTRRRGRMVALSSALAIALVTGSAFGVAAVTGSGSPAAAHTATHVVPDVRTALGRSPYGYGGGSGFGGSASASSGGTALASATAAQEVGVVDITSQLTYAQAESAGTGIVLSSDGEILTNNHVVEGATSISVTVIATGAVYTAAVVGTDATDDVAVLQLSGASGLATAALDTSGDTVVGESVTGVGNAGGTGGTPSASPGTVTALDQTITTQAEQTAASETLSGLIETDADIQAGDSGGPLFDSSDRVIGIDTAAQEGGSTVAGYAIPIEDALAIAAGIEAGQASSTVTIGYPAFLGVEVASDLADGTATGAAISGVVDGGPAAEAGLVAGDTITAIDGAAVSSAQELTTALASHRPGQTVAVTWADQDGASHTADVTLAQGPVA